MNDEIKDLNETIRNLNQRIHDQDWTMLDLRHMVSHRDCDIISLKTAIRDQEKRLEEKDKLLADLYSRINALTAIIKAWRELTR